jgi:hypothetical protein
MQKNVKELAVGIALDREVFVNRWSPTPIYDLCLRLGYADGFVPTAYVDGSNKNRRHSLWLTVSHCFL